MIEFRPNFTIINNIPGCYTIEEIDNETSVYSATPEFVRRHCGPIANNILDNVPESYFEEANGLNLFPNIDVRIHRLYPGDYPAYPDWHCDGEYRETYFSQPDLDKIPVSKHVVCTVSTHKNGISNCEFLLDSIDFVDKANSDMQSTQAQHNLWGRVHEAISPNSSTYQSQDGEIVMFDARSLHRVMPAKRRGWRLFFRISMWHKPNLGEGGKISKQEQVYKLVESSGW